MRLLLALIAVCVGLYGLAHTSGSVGVEWRSYRWDLSYLDVALVGSATIAAIVTILVVLNALLELPSLIGRFIKKRLEFKSRKDLSQAFSQLMLGQFAGAQKLALKRVNYSTQPGLHMLLAALSAFQQKKHALCDRYLAQAGFFDSNQSTQQAIDFFKAQIKASAGYSHEAERILEELFKLNPKNGHFLKHLIELYRHHGNTEKIFNCLPQIKKLEVYEGDELVEFEKVVLCEMLTHAYQSGDRSRFSQLWDNLSRAQKQSLEVKVHYFEGLAALNWLKPQAQVFQQFIEHHLNQEVFWQLLSKLEHLPTHLSLDLIAPKLAHIPISLAHTIIAQQYLKKGDLEKSRQIAENCANLWQVDEVFEVLAHIYEKSGQSEKALKCYTLIRSQPTKVVSQKVLPQTVASVQVGVLPQHPLIR